LSPHQADGQGAGWASSWIVPADQANGDDEQKGESDPWDNARYKRFYIFTQGSYRPTLKSSRFEDKI